MAISVESEDSVTGVGYWTSNVFGARDILKTIADAFDDDLTEGYPSHPVYDGYVYEVTITVEKQ